MNKLISTSLIAVSLSLAACSKADKTETKTPAVKVETKTPKTYKNIPWSYEGEGAPAHWADLKAEFEACGAGRQQSPIDLAAFGGQASGTVDLKYRPSDAKVINDGQTIKASFEPGQIMRSGGVRHELVHIHLHTPSEHVIDGKSFPLTAHFVHQAKNGDLAVLGVMFEEGAGNPVLGSILRELDDKDEAAFRINTRTLVPEDLSVYRYDGSQTTPPCSEGVKWHVALQPLTANARQLNRLNVMMGDNARPVQALNGRTALDLN